MEQGSQKLRSSCDRCTLLKVRCNKQRPSCERCSKAFEKCVYAPYRWKGRPGPGNDKTRLGPGPQYSPATDQLSPGSGTASDRPSTKQACVFLDPSAPIVEWQTHPVQDVNDFINMLDMDLQMTSQDGSYGGEAVADSIPSSELGSVTVSAQIDRGPEPTDAFIDMINQSPALGDYDCDRIMLGLLQALHKSNLQCKSATNPVAGTSPQRNARSSSSNYVMKSNRAARQHLDFLLTRRCRDTCLTSLDSRYLLRSICFRIQTRYENVFSSIMEDTLPSPAVSKDGGDGIDSYVQPGPVFFDPVQFGDFPLGYQGEKRINAELLLCELQAFSSVVARVGDMNIENQSGVAVKGTEHDGMHCASLSHGAEPAFEALLHDRIDGLTKHIKMFRDSIA